ncbi:MAG: molybdopterin-synthase adenylyltransferase MoeB [Pseudomonadota bacterium]
MIFVLALALTIWFAGRAAGFPAQARWLALGLLYIAVLFVQVALPAGNPLREITGREPALWLLIGGLVAVVYGYRALLMRVKAQAGPGVETEAPRPETFSESELERYARHIVLRELGGPGQKRMRDARVLVIGAGGLGSPALLYLAGAGMGTIGVIDDDIVSNANLQRQVIHRDRDIGMPKVFSAERAMKELNPYITVRPYNRRLSEEIVADLLDDYDLVLDGTDNFETRHLVNRACVAKGLPLISGALSQWEGQISVFDPARGAPCYACVFPTIPEPGLAPSCAEAGVFGPLPGVVGAMMAAEAVKLVSGAGTPMRGQMLIYDALEGETRRIAVRRRGACTVCGGAAVSRFSPIGHAELPSVD